VQGARKYVTGAKRRKTLADAKSGKTFKREKYETAANRGAQDSLKFSGLMRNCCKLN